MATLSIILAWKIPWTEEPGGLQSIGLNMTEATEQYISTYKYIQVYKKHVIFYVLPWVTNVVISIGYITPSIENKSTPSVYG